MVTQVLQLLLNGAMAGTILAVPAIGLSTIFAVLRFANFALAGHMAMGAFAGYVVNAWAGLPAYAAIPAAFAFAGLVGILSDHLGLRPLRRYGALTLAIASIALNLVLENLLRFGFGNSPRDYAIKLVRDWTFGPIRIGRSQVVNPAVLSGSLRRRLPFQPLADERDMA